MKQITILAVLAASSLGAILAVPGQRQGEWKKVDDAMKKGLPKTAVKELEPIIRAALREQAYGEAAKAITLKIALEGNVQGNKPEEKITRLESVIEGLPKEMKPALEVVLANWYWHYFQRNRWRFMQRTQTAEPPGDDILSWDLPRILAEIDKHYTAALKRDDWLKRTPVSQFDDLLEKGTMPDTYRPTMFDFVAHEALQFYSAGEQAGSVAEDAFVLTADTPVFAAPGEFLKWTIDTTDSQSATVKAVRLYQRLLAFHQDDAGQVAFADADLGRLEFANAHAFGEEKPARYKAALKRFSEQWAEQAVSARALHAWAQQLRSENELVEAHKLAKKGWESFPDSVGGKLCFNLMHQIEAKHLQLSIERVWNSPWPSVHVQYRNLTRVHFRAVRYDWEQLRARRDYNPGAGLPAALRETIIRQRPDRTWSHDLESTDDYQQRSVELPVPRDLTPGFYFLVASADPGFGDTNNQVSVAGFWVSQLALIVRTGHGQNQVEGFVLDAESGEPIRNAGVRAWSRSRNRQWVASRTVNTDANGVFRISNLTSNTFVLLARHGQQMLSTGSRNAYNMLGTTRPYQKTIFFTDRSLYRPGQTIRFKGICFEVDQDRDDYHTLANEPVTVTFRDANGQEIAKQPFRTNKFGSFSGSFTAPRDRLTGRMALVDAARRGSAAYVNVEEYKRPKFRVELEAPDKPARLGAKVTVPGKATAYTGAAIGGAKVAYRVVREVRFPVWCFWWRATPLAPQEIAHGSARTREDGSFAVHFTARPAPSAVEKDEPIFQFTVYADVTDSAGETRSDQRRVNVGYTALTASLSAAEWQTVKDPVRITVVTQSLDGQTRAAKGTITVHHLKQPAQVHRSPLVGGGQPVYRLAGHLPNADGEPDLSDPRNWPLGPKAAEKKFATNASGATALAFELGAGPYRAMLETEDAFGHAVTAQLQLLVLDPAEARLGVKLPNLVAAPVWRRVPGQTFTALWGTGYEAGRAFVEIEHRGKMLQSYWTRPGVTQVTIEQAVSEAMRGGFTLHVTQVHDNRAYQVARQVVVPWTNKQLAIRWEHFTSKLKPGQEESWEAVISGPAASKVAAEMVATLYDASLDAYLPHNWPNLQVFRQDRSRLNSIFENYGLALRHIRGNWPPPQQTVSISYRSLPREIAGSLWGYGWFSRRARQMGNGLARDGLAMEAAAPAAAMDFAEGEVMLGTAVKDASRMALGGRDKMGAAPATPALDLSKVSARKNLNETAFFFPQLTTDDQGRITLRFTMPEALTEWRFLALAHDDRLRSGYLSDTAVTSKDLMVQPMPPRFVREGDVIEMTVKVTNQSPTRQTGTVRLTLADARTMTPVDEALGNLQVDRPFDIPSKQSRTVSWRLAVPDGMGFLTYKAVGSTGRLSDGEEGFLPVLSRRILVTESLPLPIRGATTKEFQFSKLLDSAKSDTLRQESLTVQMVSNPAWYAVMALPYLMEYPYECTEQTFNRLYANQLARYIAASDPKIRRVFDQWKGTPALDSPLEKNEDLKAVMLEETPWVRQAKSEAAARRNVGILFDTNRLDDETSRILRKLADMQLADGAWPWFPGGRANDYITLYITTGFGRLRHLGTDIDVQPAVKALGRLDGWIDKIYRDILRHGDKARNHLTPTIALYLYGRSFFLDDQKIDAKHQEAVDYFLGQARKYWLQLANRQSQAHLALALKRFGDRKTPADIMRSIKERSVTDDELGMFWRETELSWWWYRAPIETQAMMIEAFDEVMNDAEAVELCRVWLIKQKQTQDWKTTKATADAIYGLLLRGTDLLASDALVRVSLGAVEIEPQHVEAGTGFYEQRFVRDEIKPQMGRIKVTKTDTGVSWGSVHWQYLEDMAKVTPYEGTPLTLKKSVYVKKNTGKGPVLQPVDGPLSVGDELVVRVELRVDRDMEYVHLKDQRGSGVEPVDVLSRYRYQDGLAYYQSTKDTASHFFIDYLPKGTYVFEYSTRVVHRGQYQTGMAQIQCMYAPEFNSHSQSIKLEVQ